MDRTLFEPHRSLWSRIEASGPLRALRSLEPIGVVLAVVALLYTAVQFEQDREEREEGRAIQRQTLHALAWQTLENARGKGFNAGAVAALKTLRDADFNFMAGIELPRTWLFDADFSGAKLAEASFSEADLTRANLTAAQLTGANLVGTILRRASLREADLTDADLSGADVSGADFTQALGLEQEQLDEACSHPDQPPILPAGTLSPPPPC